LKENTLMLDLGFVSAIFADKSFEEVIDFASANGFKCVEIMCWPKGIAERRYAGVTHIDVDDFNAEKINSYLQKKGIYISALGYYPNPMDEDLEKRNLYVNHIKKVISAAKALDIPVVNTFIGRHKTKNLTENIALFKEIWPAIIQHAENNQIKIGIENCPMYFTNDEWPAGKNIATNPAVWQELFDLSHSTYLGLNYDPSHMIWQQMDYLAPLENFSDRIFHIHLKDAKFHKEKYDLVGPFSTPLEYHDPKLPGRGDVNWLDFFEQVKKYVRKSGPVIIEFEDKDFEKSDELIVKGLQETRDFLYKYL
jgi:sugar phosphate isomerase/epimerase